MTIFESPEAANAHWVAHLLTCNKGELPAGMITAIGTVAIMVMTENFAPSKLSLNLDTCRRQLLATLEAEGRFKREQLLIVLGLTEDAVKLPVTETAEIITLRNVA